MALEFLARGAVAITASLRPIARDGDMALVDIRIPVTERARLATLLGGVHGLVLEESLGVEGMTA